MLTMVGRSPHRNRSLGVNCVTAPTGDCRWTRRCHMLCFIDDEDVERVQLARLGIGRLGVDAAEQPLRSCSGEP